VKIADLIEKTGLTKNQIRKVISKNKNGIRQTTRFTTDIIYETFIKDNVVNNGCISVPILSIREIEPELVYDFTTRSDNHSFVASSFVTHNCPAETPEGQSIGVVKNISYMGHITIPTNSSSLYDYVKPHLLSVNDTPPEQLYGKVKVFVNGAWLGVTDSPMELYQDMKDKKYKGIINIYTSIIFDFKTLEIRVCNDGGRLTRPVLRVKNNKAIIDRSVIDRLADKELSWNDLLTNCKLDESVIEYIDPEEQNFAMIAMKCKHGYLQDIEHTFNYTHCEIHPSTIFGVLASCIPFPEHNQAPRNTYQCLGPDETVWMSDGSKKAIKDIKIGEKVLSFNPETLVITETSVVNHFVRQNEHPIYRLKTISGREIIATEDHKFMTNNGWKTVGEIRNNMSDYKIGISVETPTFNIENETDEQCELVISIDMFVDKLKNIGITENSIKKYVTSLTAQNLLPIYKNNKKLNIISRIVGYLLSDGSINVYVRNGTRFTQCQFDFGQHEDAESFEHDLELLGFNKCKILEGTREFNNITHHTFHTSHNGALPALLISLDVSYGKKTETPRKSIPAWIMEGSPVRRREFLRGFQGGDGCKIRWNKMDKRGYNFICGETSQQINPKYKDSLKTFMTQCVEILRENEIEVSDATEQKMSDDRVKLSFKISDKQTNLIKYYDTIGYVYCRTKNVQSFKIVEYLKAKNVFSQKHIARIEDIRKMHDNGMTNPDIASNLGVKCNYVSDAVRSYKNGRKISTPNINDFNIENWLNKDIEEKNNCVFIPVDNITQEPDGLISDIEVESENHSFIAGSNFLSSNCAMGKQAMGVYATNYDQRMDKTAYVLNYPSRPLVDTRLMNFIHLNQIPSGTQIHVAIMTHTGYNQEDSVLINKGSLDRGLFLATIYHTEKDEDKNIIRDEIIRCKPDPTKTKGIKFGNYDKLDANGFITENQLVENRDVIIAKTIPIKENRNDPTKTVKYEDQSKTFRTTEETYIDKNYTGRNGDGYNFAKVRVRILRKPVLGDKISSRHGQKGTVGNIIPECDMPFTKNGLRPDVIINPHAIPSRMTIAQLKETLLGKVLLELGMFGDGTSFGNLDIKTICSELLRLGYESYGNELMYNGLTGEQLETSIYIGPVFYQRLKHMVNDKQHSRSIGPMVNLTRQPAEGRSRDGGFRIGEMERDVMIAHGMSRFCRERLYDVSDKYSVHVCKKCGMIASFNDGNKNRMYANTDFTIHLCKTCDNKTEFARVEIPYAYKLMSQELQTINVVPRIITE
jgi:intein/homing endonuclease